MAQQEDTFLIRLVTELQDTDAFDRVQGEMADFANASEQVRGRIGGLMQHLDQLVGSAGEGFAGLRQKIRTLDQHGSLEEIQQDFQEIKNHARFQDILQRDDVATQKLLTTIIQVENAFEELRDTQQIAAGSVEKKLNTNLQSVNSKVDATRVKTNQLSQAMLQGMQDVQFGVLGVANNLQMMGESIARQTQKGASATALLGQAFKNLVAGPFAIGTVITLVTILAQNIDKLPKPVKELVTQLGIAKTEFEKFLDSLDEGVDKLTELQKGQEFLKPFTDILEKDGELLVKLSRRFSEITRKLHKYNKAHQKLNQIRKEAGQAGIRSGVDPGAGPKELARATGRDVEQIRSLIKATQMEREQVEKLNRQKKALKNIIDASSAESIKELKLRKKLGKITGWQGEKLDKLVDRYQKLRDTAEKARKQEKALQRLQELRVQTMTEGIPRSFAKIENQLRQDIKSLREEFGDTPFIDQLIAERREKARQERQKKIESWWKSTMNMFVEEGKAMRFEVGGNFSDIFLPFGPKGQEQQNRKEFVKKAERQLKRAMAQIEFEQQALQNRQNIGSPLSILGITSDRTSEDVLRKQKELQQRQLEARLEHIRKVGEVKNVAGAKLLTNTEDLTEKEIQLWKSATERKEQIERKFQQKRLALHLKASKKIAQQLAGDNPIAQGTQKLVSRLGAIWEGFQEDRIQLSGKSTAEQARIISQMGGKVLGAASQITSGIFQTWKSRRKQELKEEGKTAKERRKILKKEGKKRFQFMKAMKIAKASANVAEGITQALALPFPLNWAQAAAVSAAGLMRIRQIAQLSIGDKLSGGGGGGAGGLSGGEFTQLSPSRNERRAQEFQRGTGSQSKQMNRAANKIDKAATKIQNTEITYNDRTAVDINQRAEKRQNRVNQ